MLHHGRNHTCLTQATATAEAAKGPGCFPKQQRRVYLLHLTRVLHLRCVSGCYSGRRIWWLACFCVFLIPAPSPSQSPQGQLVGAVRDVTGGRIPAVSITVQALHSTLIRSTTSNGAGEFLVAPLPPDSYRVTASKAGWATVVYESVVVTVGSSPSLSVVMQPQAQHETVVVQSSSNPLSLQATSSVIQTVVTSQQIASLPLAFRSFANIAYTAPMTEPVEPSDPTKARITAVSFAGSSGLNVDLSVDGGDNNDDYIGGFLQNYSPEAMQEFVVRTSQFGADTSRTNGGSVIIATRHGTDQWHGGGAFFERAAVLNARNPLDNPLPNPKQPFSRQDGVADVGGPLVRGKLWFFTSYEAVREDASVAYSNLSLSQFQALSQLVAQGQVPGVPSLSVPSSVPVPFRDQLFDSRIDWSQSSRSQWFLRGAFDLNNTTNSLVQQGALPSTGAFTRARYYSLLVSNQFGFDPSWLGSLTLEASGFSNRQTANSHLGMALAFPFSSTLLTTSGFETLGDNQFITPITAFPILRKQQKYQFRYDVAHLDADHALKIGVNLIHEPVLSGEMASSPERLVIFPQDPAYYLSSGQSILPIIQNTLLTGGGNGGFAQNIQRLGLYVQDSWRVLPDFTINDGLRYDTTFGLFQAEGQSQDFNPAVLTVQALGLPITQGIPHDYRLAFSPRLGIAYAPGKSANTVIRAGFGLYYNDLAQNGWVQAFQAVNTPFSGLLAPSAPGYYIDPNYRSPYDLAATAALEHNFGAPQNPWQLQLQYEHHEGVHQYRRYEYVAGYTLPANAPDLSVFRSDNRSRYDGFSAGIQHPGPHVNLSAHYTFASADTWGATVGELFDYVNGVSDVRHPFGPGDYGPSGEDVRHRVVLAAVWNLPKGFQLSTLAQAESARPFTLFTPVDVNNDGVATNDRAVINGVQTSLDQFRGTPFEQVDLRVTRRFQPRETLALQPFIEFFNLFNRINPGNNFLPDLGAEPVPVNNLYNATAFCLNTSCTQTAPIHSLNQLRVPAGTLGDFFGPGTTVGLPFAAQVGVRVTF
jgi:hypothetical protein